MTHSHPPYHTRTCHISLLLDSLVLHMDNTVQRACVLHLKRQSAPHTLYLEDSHGQ